MTDAASTQDTPEQELPPYPWKEDTVKGSEKFFDLLKIEQDRLHNKLRTGDERARNNSTAALAAVGVVTILRTLTPTIPLWSLVLFLGLVLAILILTAVVIFNRNTYMMTPSGLEKERGILWDDSRTYMMILHHYLAGLVKNIKELDTLQRIKFLLLDIQNSLLILLLAVLMYMLYCAASGLK